MKTEKSFIPNADRYQFDFDLCNFRLGWAQLDTNEDASYYGHWANPLTLEFKSYIEGDLTEHKADTPEEFRIMIRDWMAWAKGAELNPRIDTMCREEITSAFIKLGMGDLVGMATTS